MFKEYIHSKSVSKLDVGIIILYFQIAYSLFEIIAISQFILCVEFPLAIKVYGPLIKSDRYPPRSWQTIIDFLFSSVRLFELKYASSSTKQCDISIGNGMLFNCLTDYKIKVLYHFSYIYVNLRKLPDITLLKVCNYLIEINSHSDRSVMKYRLLPLLTRWRSVWQYRCDTYRAFYISAF